MTEKIYFSYSENPYYVFEWIKGNKFISMTFKNSEFPHKFNGVSSKLTFGYEQELTGISQVRKAIKIFLKEEHIFPFLKRIRMKK